MAMTTARWQRAVGVVDGVVKASWNGRPLGKEQEVGLALDASMVVVEVSNAGRARISWSGSPAEAMSAETRSSSGWCGERCNKGSRMYGISFRPLMVTVTVRCQFCRESR